MILIIPLNVILATIVSLLVGFNVALSIFAFRVKKSLQTKTTSLAAGIGATSGLFVGCPTCAGSLISALLGIGVVGAGGASASVLAPFQTVFIAASIPALVVAPCADVMTTPPGTYRDVFKSELEFEGTVDGEPAEANVLYMGRVQPGGAIEGRLVFSNGVQGRLEVDAVVAVGGDYSGEVVVN